MKNNFKSASQLVFLHIGLLFLGTTIYFVLLASGLLNSISVYFYRGICLLILTLVFMVAVYGFLKKIRLGSNFAVKDIILSLVLIFSMNLLFFTHVPVTADRSISVFLLGYMSGSSETVYDEEVIKKVFIDEYVLKNENIEKRLEEQISSGNISRDLGGYRITDQGKKIVRFYVFISRLLNIRSENIKFK